MAIRSIHTKRCIDLAAAYEMMRTPSQKLVWGWLRLGLGILQQALALAGLASWWKLGLHPLTISLAVVATLISTSSFFFYSAKRWRRHQKPPPHPSISYR